MIQLYGQPYHPNTLCAVPPDTDAIMNRVSSIIDKLPQFVSLISIVIIIGYCLYNFNK